MTEETILKHQVKDYLKFRGVFRFHNLAGLGVYPGIPDDFAVYKGKVYGLEYKAKKGRMSEYQKTFQENWESGGLGNTVYLEVRSLEDVINIFK